MQLGLSPLCPPVGRGESAGRGQCLQLRGLMGTTAMTSWLLGPWELDGGEGLQQGSELQRGPEIARPPPHTRRRRGYRPHPAWEVGGGHAMRRRAGRQARALRRLSEAGPQSQGMRSVGMSHSPAQGWLQLWETPSPLGPTFPPARPPLHSLRAGEKERPPRVSYTTAVRLGRGALRWAAQEDLW